MRGGKGQRPIDVILKASRAQRGPEVSDAMQRYVALFLGGWVGQRRSPYGDDPVMVSAQPHRPQAWMPYFGGRKLGETGRGRFGHVEDGRRMDAWTQARPR